MIGLGRILPSVLLMTTTSLAPSAAIAVLAFAPLTPALAAANGEITCRVTFYYSSAKKDKQVGYWAHCPGGGKSGRVTQWFSVETFTVGHPNPPQSPQPGSLPCEFLAAGCGAFGH